MHEGVPRPLRYRCRFISFYRDESEAIAQLDVGVTIAPRKEEKKGYWQLKATSPMFAPYKNDILKKWQDALRKRGIISEDDLKLYTAQAIQENGSLSPLTIGDNGCSLGLPQRNFCSHADITAKTALERWKEWETIDHQIEWFADSSKKRLKEHKSVKWAIIAHNAPVLASKRIEPRYWRDVNKRTKEIEWQSI